MPLTVSHIAAVIPFSNTVKKHQALSALIIGSMTPDIAYLTPFLVDQRMESHSLIGLYLFCIPMGLTVYFLYHLLMSPVMTTLLPENIRTRLSPHLLVGKLPSTPSIVLVLSIVAGALTHIFWDYFTHQIGLASSWKWFDTPLMRIDGYDIMPYRLLQHGSSVIGLLLLLYWGKRWVQKTDVKNQSLSVWKASQSLRNNSLLVLIVLPFIAGVYFGIQHMPETDVLYGIYSAQVFVRYFIVGAAAVFLLACLVLGIVYRLQIKK